MQRFILSILVVTSLIGVCRAQATYRVEYTLAGKLKGSTMLTCNKDMTLFQRTADVGQTTTGISEKPTTETFIGAQSNMGEPVAFNIKAAYRRDLLKHTLTYVESHTPYRYTVEDDTLPTWKILDERRTLGGYSCQKATTLFRGREFIAWFTKDIPIAGGPWKLGGLPGLILEATSVDQKYQYLFAACIPVAANTASFTFPFRGPLLTYANYVQKADAYYQERANKLHEQATMELAQRLNGSTTGPLTMNIENIEKNLEKKYVSTTEK